MDLLEAARKGRQAAFRELFEEHHLPLFRFAYRLTGSEADAQDIVQECFLQLLRPGCAYDAKRTELRTYLFGVVRNQALKRQTRREGPWEALETKEKDSPEATLLRGELAEVVARAVGLLPETQKEILILAHYEQMPLAEIGRVMGLELGAVKSRLQRARAGLKESLSSYVSKVENEG